jgi:hypothetical protein
MVRISEHFGGAYLSGEDVPPGKSYRLQCGEVHLEQFEDGTTKPVLSFQNARKQLVLNKTNASVLAAAWGDDTEGWYGGWLELFSVPTTFNGRSYNGLRVRPLEPPAVPVQHAAAPRVTVPDGDYSHRFAPGAPGPAPGPADAMPADQVSPERRAAAERARSLAEGEPVADFLAERQRALELHGEGNIPF